MCLLARKSREPAREQAPRAHLYHSRIRRALIALSLANLSFISAWQRRLYGIPFLSPSWSWLDWFTLFFNVLLLAMIFYVLLALTAKVKLRNRALDGLVYSIPLFAVTNVARRFAFPYHGRITAAVLIALPVAVGVAIVCFRRKLLPVFEFIVLGIAILFPVNLFRMALVAGKYTKAPALARKYAPEMYRGPRVVWLIFDEMDFALSFPRRPAHLRLPEFDRLRAEAFFASAAHQPASDTGKAVPDIISGREIYGFPEQEGTHTLHVLFSPHALQEDWGAAPNVFADARAAHVNVGIVGWYLPYCRIFAAVATDCYWEPIYSGVTDTPALRRSLVDELDALTPLESRVRLIQRLRHMLTAAESMVDDPQLGLVFIHLPVPHGPEIFNRYTDSVTPYAVHKDWFFDNLLIADRTLGEIRTAMQRSGLWDNSAIIVSSDHSLRESMMAHANPVPQVPFIVRMPGQTQAVTFDLPFTTEVTRPLIGAILRGEVTGSNLPDWMRQHSQNGVRSSPALPSNTASISSHCLSKNR